MPLVATLLRLRAAVAIASVLLIAAPSCAPAGESKPASSSAVGTGSKSSSATRAGAGKVIAGHATVVDGDGIEIGGTKIRLFGIDAPEIDQYCNRADGTRWRCGQYATVELDRAVLGREIACTVRDTDRYGRPVAVCRSGDVDLAEVQVKNGFAVAYRTFTRDYVDEEDTARGTKRGIWSGNFEMPWDWRGRAANGRRD